MEMAKVCNTNSGYVFRDDVCCRAIFNCPPGHEIKRCDNQHEEEKCVKCQDGLAQPFLISSFHKERSCYQSEPCNFEKYITRRNKSDTFFPNHCQCNLYNCYYDINHFCKQAKPCPVNSTLNDHGGCEQCPDNHYKLETGCGPCKMDTNKWAELVKPNETINHLEKASELQPAKVTIGYSFSDMTPNANQNKNTGHTLDTPVVGQNGTDNLYLILGSLGGIILLFVILIIFIIFLCKRRKMSLGMNKNIRCDEQFNLVDKIPGQSSNDVAVTDVCNEMLLDSMNTINDPSLTISLNGSIPILPADSISSDCILAVSGSCFKAHNNTERQISVDSTRSYNNNMVGLKPPPGSPKCVPIASITPFTDSELRSVKTVSLPSNPNEYSIPNINNHNLGALSHNTEVKRSSFLLSQA